MKTQNTFWDWSVAVYERPGVADILINLQDTHELEVNAVLFCFWCARQGIAIDHSQAGQIGHLTREWGDKITKPVRSARRVLKTVLVGENDERAALRAKLAGLELDLERHHQNALAALLGTDPITRQNSVSSPVILAKNNLDMYLRAVGSGSMRIEGAHALPAWDQLAQSVLSSNED